MYIAHMIFFQIVCLALQSHVNVVNCFSNQATHRSLFTKASNYAILNLLVILSHKIFSILHFYSIPDGVLRPPRAPCLWPCTRPGILRAACSTPPRRSTVDPARVGNSFVPLSREKAANQIFQKYVIHCT